MTTQLIRGNKQVRPGSITEVELEEELATLVDNEKKFFTKWIGPVKQALQEPLPSFMMTAGTRYWVHETGSIPLSGEFVGHNNDIAYWDGVEWSYYTPTQEGEIFFLQSNNYPYYWTGTIWDYLYVESSLTDAPSDGNTYGRKDATWVTISGDTSSGDGTIDRNKTSGVTIASGFSLVTAEYLNMNDNDLILNGDAVVVIL